ncbi:hypothetical protein A2774_03505 [Candidatus Roizmanbacteria bacterium RIFCSPHIGHO2_01_FULL_39_12c]|uniref:DUF948 domain-containing protein n=1 Tax=Candidatus Roizmanbacteria bacterium RIFCSPHIGHO2_01_FULL_39_12c TaxID=1802031 RepID=A0A1F7G913_9BACT|nr:MAG: hypothetical protein A2774_03505 [Candidatus Roizmanbacteria bacterium RIFCSPHIGHO2_01_FULL_39_12c]OGK47832.1 MAG: hypothetical protein A2963_03190 [Candidatus Roizmanbacteria bacterium RIFCSPLOWO2_01_FULL_40_13]
MDTTQLLLTIVLTVTTVLLVAVGIQLIFILKEIRKTFSKINQIVENFEKVGMSVQHSFSEISGFVSGLKSVFKVIDFIHTKKSGKPKSNQT